MEQFAIQFESVPLLDLLEFQCRAQPQPATQITSSDGRVEAGGNPSAYNSINGAVDHSVSSGYADADADADADAHRRQGQGQGGYFVPALQSLVDRSLFESNCVVDFATNRKSFVSRLGRHRGGGGESETKTEADSRRRTKESETATAPTAANTTDNLSVNNQAQPMMPSHQNSSPRILQQNTASPRKNHSPTNAALLRSIMMSPQRNILSESFCQRHRRLSQVSQVSPVATRGSRRRSNRITDDLDCNTSRDTSASNDFDDYCNDENMMANVYHLVYSSQQRFKQYVVELASEFLVSGISIQHAHSLSSTANAKVVIFDMFYNMGFLQENSATTNLFSQRFKSSMKTRLHNRIEFERERANRQEVRIFDKDNESNADLDESVGTVIKMIQNENIIRFTDIYSFGELIQAVSNLPYYLLSRQQQQQSNNTNDDNSAHTTHNSKPQPESYLIIIDALSILTLLNASKVPKPTTPSSGATDTTVQLANLSKACAQLTKLLPNSVILTTSFNKVQESNKINLTDLNNKIYRNHVFYSSLSSQYSDDEDNGVVDGSDEENLRSLVAHDLENATDDYVPVNDDDDDDDDDDENVNDENIYDKHEGEYQNNNKHNKCYSVLANQNSSQNQDQNQAENDNIQHPANRNRDDDNVQLSINDSLRSRVTPNTSINTNASVDTSSNSPKNSFISRRNKKSSQLPDQDLNQSLEPHGMRTITTMKSAKLLPPSQLLISDFDDNNELDNNSNNNADGDNDDDVHSVVSGNSKLGIRSADVSAAISNRNMERKNNRKRRKKIRKLRSLAKKNVNKSYMPYMMTIGALAII